MNAALSRFENIAHAIIRSRTVEQEVTAARELAAFYRELEKVHRLVVSKDNETKLEGGIAISSHDAAICIDEPLRTARFIKGVYAAISDLEQKLPGQKLQILYAGCGPYATLMLPLLPLINLPHLNIAFLDMHSASLNNVEALLRIMGFEVLPVQLVQADAITYRPENSLHLVVSETMFYALIREPQVNITRNLTQYLAPEGVLVPEAIHIDLVYTSLEHEHSQKIDGSPFVYSDKKYSQRKTAARLFSVNRDRSFFQNTSGQLYSSGVHTFDEKTETHPHICLFTEVHVYGEQVLASAESTITNPHCLINTHHLQGPAFSLEYAFDGMPRWEMKNPR